MMDISNLATPAEAVIIAAFVASLTQNVKQTKLPNQYLPFVAAIIGLLGGVISVYVTGDTNWAQGALAGFLLGLTTSGAVDGAKALISKKAATVVETGEAQPDEENK